MSEIMDDLEMKIHLHGLLQTNNVAVTFTKKDGTVRRLVCTLREEVINDKFAKTDLNVSPIYDAPKNWDMHITTNFAVWDIENDGWRSFNPESVIEFEVV
jgi:hypothetical protein